MRYFRIIFGCFGAGVASVIVLSLILNVVVGGERADEIIFGYSSALIAIVFGLLWFPFVKNRMK